jgi:hypothetical protein
MKLRFVKHSTLAELKNNIRKNLNRYQSGTFDEFFDIENINRTFFEVADVEFDEKAFAELVAPAQRDLKDAANAKVVYTALATLTAYQAKDDRLWVYLCHTVGLKYIRKRFPKVMSKNADEAVTEIAKHFFVSGGLRGFERLNGLSRLWAFGHLASQNSKVPLEKTLEVFLYQTDVRAQIMERPSTFLNANVFSAVMRFMMKKYKNVKHREVFFRRKGGAAPYRALFSRLNELGGVIVLGAMRAEDIDYLIAESAIGLNLN